MKKKVILFSIFLFVFMSVVSGIQQQEKLLPPEKHVAEVRLVLVDVIVKKGGEFVTDLNVDDFEIYEDDRKVPINSFELVSFARGELLLEAQKRGEIPTPIPRKQLVVLIDGICSWQRNLKQGARKIIDELISLAKLGNKVMVVQMVENKGVEVLQDFTTDEELIRKALIKASTNIWFEKSIDALKMYQEVGLAEPGTGEEAMAISEKYMERVHPMLEEEYLYRERGRFEQALGGLLAVSNMIKDLPGRKSILLISDGIPDVSSKTIDKKIDEATPERTVSGARTPQLDLRRDTATVRVFDPFNILQKKKLMSAEEVMRELIRFANAQNISIYALDPEDFTRHLVPASAEFGPREAIAPYEFRAEEKIKRIQNLSWLAEDTGGVSLRGAKKYETFYNVVSTDLNYYYQLSYYPPREKPDNKYHRIKVKVKRPGVNLRFRKGYTDYSPEEEDRLNLVSAFYNPSLYVKLPFQAEFILFHTDSRKYEPWMNIALPTKKLFLERGIGYGEKKFSLHIWVKDNVRGESAFAGAITIPFNIDESMMTLLKTTDYIAYHFKGNEIPFPRREYRAIFALYDPETDEIGTFESPVILPDFKDKKEGGVISCVLGFVSPSSRKAKKSFSISQKEGCLEYGEMKFFPSVSNRFQRMQDAALFLQLYLPQGKMSVDPEFRISGKGRITQQLPGELVAEEWNKKSGIWKGLFNLSLRTVIYGDYKLKVEVPVSKDGKTQTRELAFTKLRY